MGLIRCSQNRPARPAGKIRMGSTFRKWWTLLAFILLPLLGLAACAGEDSLPGAALAPLTAPPPATRAEPAGPSATATPAEPEQPTYTPTLSPTAESKPVAPNATAIPARPAQPTYTPRPPPTARPRPRPADPNTTAAPAGSEQPATAHTPQPVLPRPEYNVSIEFSELIKPYFFAQHASGDLVPPGGEPELILDFQGSIKIKLDDDGQARYLDLLALESEQIGEHPAHKIFRLEAMGVAVAPDVDRKIQPDSFDRSLFHSIDFEYQRGNELPTRTAPSHDDAPPAFQLQVKPRTFKTPASIIPESEMPELLLEMSGYQAWCCGFANRLPDGSVVQTKRNFHLDHLNPVSKAGTSHQITNRAPLCPYHNIMKSNHRLHLAEYREEIARNGELMVDDAAELIDLDYAAHETLAIHSERQAQQRAA